MRSSWLAALAWVMLVVGTIMQILHGLTLGVVDGDVTAVFLMAWAVYLRIGESR